MHGTTAKPDGERIIAERMSLNGQPIDPAANYRVTVNNFLSVGGDGFTVLTQGNAPQIGIYDVDALHAYFKANSPVGPSRRQPHCPNQLMQAFGRRALSERPISA